MAVKAKQPLLDASIEFDGVDFSNTANEVTIEGSRAEHDVTTFQGGGYEEQTPGLKSAVINITVFQDRTGGSVHQTAAPLYEDGTPFLVIVKPDDDVVSAENPAHVMIGKLYKYNPVGAKVGDPETMGLEVKNGSKLGLKEAKTPEELVTIKEEAEGIL
jgi:hypothetical protein